MSDIRLQILLFDLLFINLFKDLILTCQISVKEKISVVFTVIQLPEIICYPLATIILLSAIIWPSIDTLPGNVTPGNQLSDEQFLN